MVEALLFREIYKRYYERKTCIYRASLRRLVAGCIL